MIPGIDISMYQWTKGIPFSVLATLKRGGIGFIVCRASIGTRIDPAAITTIKRVQDAGLQAGAYHFLDDAVLDGKAQAETFWGQIEKAGGPRDIIMVNDIETTAGNQPTWRQGRDWARRIDELSGNAPLTLYTNRSTAYALGNPDAATVYDYLWQALWTQSETLAGGLTLPAKPPAARFMGFREAAMWQYGSMRFTPVPLGSHRHVSGRDMAIDNPAARATHSISVDGDAFYGTAAELGAMAKQRKRLPLSQRPNYRAGYKAAQDASLAAIGALTQPVLPPGPAAPAGWSEAIQDAIAAIGDTTMGD